MADPANLPTGFPEAEGQAGRIKTSGEKHNNIVHYGDIIKQIYAECKGKFWIRKED